MPHEFTPKVLERFWSKVDFGTSPNSCHLWRGPSYKAGYGRISIGNVGCLAHRVAWEISNGPIPPGLCVCHRCDTPACVNVAHMFLGTRADNRRDCVEKGRHARQDSHGSRTKREARPRGDAHYSRLHPERMASGNRHGTKTQPESVRRADKNGMAKLDWSTVRMIRATYAAGGISQTALAERFGIAQTTVSRVLLHQTWRE